MEPSSATKRWLESLSLPIPAECWAPVGCEKCRQIGYYGAVGVFEVWRVDEDEYEWILHGVDEHALRHRLMEKGHQPLLLDALQKAHEGITSIEELRSLGDVIPPSPDRVPWAEQPVTA
jgi:general secretion pathway protein E